MSAKKIESCLVKNINRFYYPLLLAVILILAVYSRFHALALVPAGMTWDEAAIGYNGYAIWQTRRDEWLHFLPISFMSFGDYKAPLAIYLSGAFTKLLGLNLFAVRLPFALAGVMAVLGMAVLTTELLGFFPQVSAAHKKQLSLLAALLIASSPWHIHFSRAGFESGLALMFIIWGMIYTLKGLQLIKTTSSFYRSSLLMLLAVVSWVAAVYTYHSAKVTVPLLLLFILIWQFKLIRRNIKKLALPTLAGLGLLAPLLYDSFFLKGATRLNTTILGQGDSLLQVAWQLLTNFGHHLSFNFLVMGATTTLRHSDGRWGVLLITTLVLVILGVMSLIKSFLPFPEYRRHFRAMGLLAVFWVVAGLLPAALGQEAPHPNRALLALPGFIFLALIGLIELLDSVKKVAHYQTVLGSHGEKRILLKTTAGLLIFIHLLLFAGYSSDYFTRFAKDSVNDFKEGYLEAFAYAQPYEKGTQGKPEVEKIVFSDRYGQPYIYALFARKTNPIWYQGGSLIKYEFASVDIADLMRTKTLVVAAGEDETPIQTADKVIYGTDGSVRFKIYYLK